MLDLSFIKDGFDKIIEGKVEGIKPIDRSELYDNGEVFYMNGNDGTEFDHYTNDGSCEFYVFLKNGDGYIKAYHIDHKVIYYIYDREHPFSSKLQKIEIDSDYGVEEVCDSLSENFDQKGRYDRKIENWVF